MGTSPTTPPVVAIIVTCNPGPWFEETLEAVAAQDYPNLSVVFVDSASDEDPSAQMASSVPDGYVHRLDRRVGFGQAANEALVVVEGASFFVFCHDDVAPSPDAFRLMVEEALRSNAGVVTPKVVEWDRPDRLISVGLGADRVGVVQPLVERGELDQEQHDRVRQVFVAPGGVTLIRADLFTTLGGFSADIDEFGEDLDLSWRAHLAGARVVTAPDARVRHLEAQMRGLRDGSATPLARRRTLARAETHRLRTLAVCTGTPRLPFILTLAVVENLMQAFAELLMGRPGEAGVSVRSIGGALQHPARLLHMRRIAQACRQVGDLRVAARQTRGSARLRAFVGTRLHGEASTMLSLSTVYPTTVPLEEAGARDAAVGARAHIAAHSRRSRAAALAGVSEGLATSGASGFGDGARAGRVEVDGADDLVLLDLPGDVDEVQLGDIGERRAPPGRRKGGRVRHTPADGEIEPEGVRVGRGTWQSGAIVAALLLILLLIGSRGLLGDEFPAIGRIPVTSGGLSEWWRTWWTTWQGGLVGGTGASPPGLGLLTLAGTLFFGAVGALQRVIVFLPFVIGPLGAYRAARWWRSMWGRVAAMLAYALVPVPYNALAHGNWPGLLAYAAAPFALSMISRLSGQLPFPPTTGRAVIGRTVGVGVLIALVASFAPSWLVLVPAVGAAMTIGSLLAGQRTNALRSFAVSLAAAAVAIVLLLPWSAGVLGSRTALFGVQAGGSAQLGLGQVLRMHTGPVGSLPLGWALLAAAALPLLIGRSWRLAWAARLWMVALLAFGLVWAGSRGWLPTPPPEDLLCFAAAALAGSVALGAVAFELDLPGYRLGWRQLATGIAAVAVVVAGVPTMAAAGNGRWHLPSADASSVLGFLPTGSRGDYRVLWLGSPAALPLASASLANGVAYATSFDGEPVEADQWAPPRNAGATALGADIRSSALGLTTQLGHLLAPFGIRYIVVPNHDAPAGSGAMATPVDPSILTGLTDQTDLESVSSDPNYTVYVNSAWAAVRSLSSPALARVVDAPESAQSRLLGGADLAGKSRPVLTGSRQDRASGVVPGGSTIAVAMSRTSSWTLAVDGHKQASEPAYGWAMRFSIPRGAASQVSVSAGTALGPRVGVLVEMALWVLALALLTVDRRWRLGRASERVRAEWFIPLSSERTRRGRTGSRSGLAVGDADLDSDELWIDA